MRAELRGIDSGLRKLAEAFPEFYDALRDAIHCLRAVDPQHDHPMTGKTLQKARAVLKRMRGES